MQAAMGVLGGGRREAAVEVARSGSRRGGSDRAQVNAAVALQREVSRATATAKRGSVGTGADRATRARDGRRGRGGRTATLETAGGRRGEKGSRAAVRQRAPGSGGRHGAHARRRGGDDVPERTMDSPRRGQGRGWRWMGGGVRKSAGTSSLVARCPESASRR